MGSAKMTKTGRSGDASATLPKTSEKGTWVGHLLKKLMGQCHQKPSQAEEEGNGFVLDNWGRPIPVSPRGNLPCLFFYSECRRGSGPLYDVPPFNPAIHGHQCPQGDRRA
ncbi:hypothetical protein BESB_047970 [Besnoitia besnoiti]|uniref:Uncharacterized protein n=1 Tax=Besnoitia besnoiti TaxID=94643 RepID=A0A2A9MF44_BESBE|nr:hypothetical protein BESB_047970 [Besnoitia besnoiti]PFH36605.1 hypothetical protein BESB_047970 [Besnoitia besnoiti]